VVVVVNGGSCEVVDARACAGRRLKSSRPSSKLSGMPSQPMMQPPRNKSKATNSDYGDTTK